MPSSAREYWTDCILQINIFSLNVPSKSGFLGASRADAKFACHPPVAAMRCGVSQFISVKILPNLASDPFKIHIHLQVEDEVVGCCTLNKRH